ncbi:replicative DNA helicase [Nostoc sp. TCL26-01]|uniref:replicative DNA helicase n=1 Tax=Nostoc sp. TCL26-01 TaxID=2576904 RepID=UPI0015BF347D|nr:replicative DNA helicase [Nostoc sp. TCL26-01]QLE60024.1 replicative DNA helicase [Nostoc sp. TCL26-01]
MSDSLNFTGTNDRLPPQNIEAEEAILGGILLDPEAMERVVDILSPEAFYINAHKDIYQATLWLYNQNKPTDLLSVTSWLTDNDLLVRVGGRNKLATLVDRTVSAVNIDALAEMVMDKYLSRKLISTGNEILKLGFEQSKPLVERLDVAEQKIFSIRHQSQLDNEPEILGDISVRVFSEIQKIAETGELPGVPTGFYDLDAMLGGGFQPGDLIVVGGRPSMGKSSFCHQIALNISRTYQSPTMIFSLEMSKEDINKRFLVSETKIEIKRLRSGSLSESQWEVLAGAVKDLAEIPLLIDDQSCPSVTEIRSKVRKAIAKHGQLKLVVIDYLQLMADGSDAFLVQKIGEITRQLKLLARECKLPIILLSQLNRGVEGRNNKRPLLSDVRESGRIEEDADIVLGLYRDEYYSPDSLDRGIAEVIILKYRNGPTGTVKLLFDPMYTQFKNLASSKNS